MLCRTRPYRRLDIRNRFSDELVTGLGLQQFRGRGVTVGLSVVFSYRSKHQVFVGMLSMIYLGHALHDDLFQTLFGKLAAKDVPRCKNGCTSRSLKIERKSSLISPDEVEHGVECDLVLRPEHFIEVISEMSLYNSLGVAPDSSKPLQYVGLAVHYTQLG